MRLVSLTVLIFAFSLVRDLRWLPVMFISTALLYRLARLPLGFLWSRLRYPGFFLLIMALLLPFTGETALLHVGPLAVYREGLITLLLVASRFTCILTIGLIMFGTAPFTETLNTMRSFGLPALLTDMTLLAWRYLFETGTMLATMDRAMRLRGFDARRLSWRGLQTWAALAGTLIIRSYEQSERVYAAMKLRGYGQTQQPTEQPSTTTEDTPALAIHDLSFAYPQQQPILADVSLTIQPGERVGLIGPNGAGKTSLFMLVGGVLQPTGGTINVFGKTINKGAFNPAIGLVFQNPNDQLFSPAVRDDVAFGPLNMGLPADEVERLVQEALRTTGTLALADRPPHHLSGGEKRMVAIASVLTMTPQLVIYDEPDANLDIRARRRLIEFLLAAEQTLLIASHDLELIREVCDRVLLLDGGTIAAAGPTQTILRDETLMTAHGLEKPHSLIPHAPGTHNHAATDTLAEM